MLKQERLKEKINKKAISELVSYVLLITLAIAIAAGTFLWLESVVKLPKYAECPDINLILLNYTCYKSNENFPGSLSINLQNRGKFDIDGFKIMVSNFTSSKIYKKIDILSQGDECIKHGWYQNTYYCRINATQETSVEVLGKYSEISEIKEILISPIKRVEGNVSYCKPTTFDIDICFDNQIQSQGHS